MIRFALPGDLKAINTIYRQAVRAGLQTAHTEAPSLKERRRWFDNHSRQRHPVFVYERKGMVTGWLSVSPYRAGRQALDEVVEISYYVHSDHQGQGVGTRLIERAIDFCGDTGYRIMVAILIEGNEASLALLNKFDFREGGRIPEAVHYRETFRDHLYYYKRLVK